MATGFDGAHNVTIEDIDGDGNSDLLADAYRANDVCWYKQPADPINDPWVRYDIDLHLPNDENMRCLSIN